MDLKKSYNNLPMPVQYLLLGGISFLAFQVYKKITSNQTTSNEAQADLQKEVKKEIIRLKDICDNMIKQLCQHDFEEDYIDITQYRGENITYYKIGCYTK